MLEFKRIEPENNKNKIKKKYIEQEGNFERKTVLALFQEHIQKLSVYKC